LGETRNTEEEWTWKRNEDADEEAEEKKEDEKEVCGELKVFGAVGLSSNDFFLETCWLERRLLFLLCLLLRPRLSSARPCQVAIRL